MIVNSWKYGNDAGISDLASDNACTAFGGNTPGFIIVADHNHAGGSAKMFSPIARPRPLRALGVGRGNEALFTEPVGVFLPFNHVHRTAACTGLAESGEIVWYAGYVFEIVDVPGLPIRTRAALAKSFFPLGRFQRPTW